MGDGSASTRQRPRQAKATRAGGRACGCPGPAPTPRLIVHFPPAPSGSRLLHRPPGCFFRLRHPPGSGSPASSAFGVKTSGDSRGAWPPRRAVVWRLTRGPAPPAARSACKREPRTEGGPSEMLERGCRPHGVAQGTQSWGDATAGRTGRLGYVAVEEASPPGGEPPSLEGLQRRW